LYEIKKLAPGQRLVLRTRFGGLQETEQFLLQEKSQVTGYPSDEGFILRDKQEAVAGETPRPAPKPAPIGPKPDDELTEQQYYDARVKEIARDNKATQAEVREQFSREDSNLEHWQAIRNAAESGKQLKVETLNRLPEARIEFLRKQYPQSVPQGYMAPAVSKSVAEKQAEMRAAKRGVRLAPAPAPAEPVTAEPTEAELEAAEEARLAQAEQDIDAGPIGQAKQKLEDEGSDMTKRQVKAMARKLEASGVIDDSELDDEGRDTGVDELVGQLLERVEEARDTAIQEREQELADEAKAEKAAAPKAPAPVPTPAAPAPTKKAAKDPATMTASEINKELDRLSTKDDALRKELIDAGRGAELSTETIEKTDPLSLRSLEIWDRRSELFREISSRAGPNTSRLPAGQKGFGPRKTAAQSAIDAIDKVSKGLSENSYSDPLFLTPLAKLALQIAKGLIQVGVAVDKAIRQAIAQARQQFPRR
jgi:hypothetical protein